MSNSDDMSILNNMFHYDWNYDLFRYGVITLGKAVRLTKLYDIYPLPSDIRFVKLDDINVAIKDDNIILAIEYEGYVLVEDFKERINIEHMESNFKAIVKDYIEIARSNNDNYKYYSRRAIDFMNKITDELNSKGKSGFHVVLKDNEFYVINNGNAYCIEGTDLRDVTDKEMQDIVETTLDNYNQGKIIKTSCYPDCDTSTEGKIPKLYMFPEDVKTIIEMKKEERIKYELERQEYLKEDHSDAPF
ncbi:hypothetical protein B0W47_16815 (plasmid) [Komagataeibacter nataicola]|uniref:Uncharacterized protein n=1 Tax=Komagataeibacter nataicola TaxID=265960 RepID=A0A9N7CTW3_9PROT|nr:hypothetical protein [Komagataeibacter nataicola]AQU89241.1 hypothetical protein B0W47_16815 [Komagataeibacter nataicola]PYD66301.1 hypothetical protein CDI09_09135 [Komagataeibacter nataicola]WNM10345.1 hypothetical protein RI056_18770 [Komagataeibacter nataicola]GBR23555.1 hypothetical protein AA0616_2552 [Komagataeibacter nataicola NRIC 0616]